MFTYGDFNSNSFAVGLNSTFDKLPLRTKLAFSINQSESANGFNTVDIIGLNVGATYFLLDERLSIFGDFAYTSNEIVTVPLVQVDADPTNDAENNNGLLVEADLYDDYFRPATPEDAADGFETLRTESNTYVFRGGARFDVNRHHAFILDGSLTNVNQRFSDFTIPNDHLVQLRYIYRF